MPALRPRPNRTRATATCSSAASTGLSVAFDLPTQLGYDSDAPQSRGEVGKVGVAIDTIADMETLFDEIPLDRVTVSMTINAPASILLALVLAVARRRGIPFEKLGGTVQNDVLKEYVARGTYIFPPVPSMRLVTDVMAYCAGDVPQLEHDLDLRLSHPRSRLDGASKRSPSRSPTRKRICTRPNAPG